MNNKFCALVGAEFPLVAFSHCRDVVAAVSRAGGFGVLGCSSFPASRLEEELRWIDDHVGGMPYGVNILVPEHIEGGQIDDLEMAKMVTPEYRNFMIDFLARYDVKLEFSDFDRPLDIGLRQGEELMDIVFRHPIKLVCNALGVAPPSMIERARRHNVSVAALVGAKEHALRQADAGVDVLVVQGTEAGGHCGEVSTLVLTAEVARALKPIRDIPILSAGGIATGEQMAGCIAMGASGVWTGTVWLATPEAETSPVIKEKILAARSRDTIRSKTRTGKPSRQLHTIYHDAWDAPGAPKPLPMPIQGFLSIPVFEAIEKAAAAGNEKARELASYWVGQSVGLVDSTKSAATVVQDFKQEFADAVSRLIEMIDD